MKLAVGLVVLGAFLAGDLTVGGEVPDMTFKTVDGKEVKLSELNKDGKVVVIISWSLDCPSGAVPRINDLAKKYGDSKKVSIVGVSAYGDSSEKISAYVKDNSLTYPVMHDSDKSVSKALGAKRVNTTYIVVGGKLFYRGGCMKNGKDKVVQAIDAALEGKEAPASDKDKLG